MYSTEWSDSIVHMYYRADGWANGTTGYGADAPGPFGPMIVGTQRPKPIPTPMTDALDILFASVDAADTLGLNDEQLEVYMKLINKNFNKLLLLGEAGSGKSFTIVNALAQLHRQGAKVLLCAPTHLARITLLNKMPEDVRPYIETRTVASLLGRFGFNTGDGGVGFSKPKADRLGGYQVIALDECSMIGKSEYDVLMSTGAKIVFTGDFKQLPAIMQKGSGMMDDPMVEKFSLRQQMRAPGVIHELAKRNRDGVHFPTESVSDAHSEVVVHASRTALLERMANDIDQDPRGVDAHPHYRFITHRNADMYEVGTLIRDVVIAADLGNAHQPLVKGEYLLNYETCPAAYNGEVVQVLDVLPDPSASHGHLWQSYKVEIRGSRGTCWVNMVDPRKLHIADEYAEQRRELLKEANKRKAFDAAKSYFDEVQHLANYYTKAFYPFAMTVHKSQGQTISHVYCDTESFQKASNKRALLYVGLSRASESLHTVKIEEPQWKKVREVNNRYKAAKVRYEQLFTEPAHKVRVRTGLGARTSEQKLILAEYLEALIADAEQAIEAGETSIEQRITPEILAANLYAPAQPTLEPIAF
jgi:exodeoxyribonuclease V